MFEVCRLHKPRLLYTGAFNINRYQLNLIEALGFTTLYIQDEMKSASIDLSDVQVVVCNNLFVKNPIELFTNLKFIQLTSVGYDRVPMDDIKSRGIAITNARGVYSVPMAEWAILKILEIYKKSRFFMQNQCDNKWVKKRDICELSYKTVLIIGYGSVGQHIAKRLVAFDCEVNAVDVRVIEDDYITACYPLSELPRAITVADIIVISLPLTTETRGLVDYYLMSLMKKNSVIVNISRGAIINESDLVKHLHEGRFMGVALDVFSEEPLVENSPLWNINNVLITPHNSFVSNSNSERLFDLVYTNLQNYVASQS